MDISLEHKYTFAPSEKARYNSNAIKLRPLPEFEIANDAVVSPWLIPIHISFINCQGVLAPIEGVVKKSSTKLTVFFAISVGASKFVIESLHILSTFPRIIFATSSAVIMLNFAFPTIFSTG